MHELLQLATAEIARWLQQALPPLSDAWWEELVLSRLSFQQERIARERSFQTLDDLDLAALLRVIDQNWHELSLVMSLPREARSWLKELQVVRNKWAHLSSQTFVVSDQYRDIDTLSRFLAAIGAPTDILQEIDAVRTNVMHQIVQPKPSPSSQVQESSFSTSLPPTKISTDHPLYAVGELVTLRSDPDQVLPVLAIIESETGVRRYQLFQDNRRVVFYEAQLQSLATTAEDSRRLNREELHATLTSLHIASPSTNYIYSLRSGRVQYIPYQYRPVLRLIRADRPRLLIADEVGVGKTIEAGLVMRELQARMNLDKILIICPKALVAERKWDVEMRRFDERFAALDGPLLRHCLEETHLDGEWPLQYSRAIIPFSLFDANLIHGRSQRLGLESRGLLQLDPPPKFDLVVVDEAHHIRNPDTYLHQGIRFLCDHADAVLFLTATPIQLGSDDLYTLLNVLRPDLIVDRHSFAKMSEPNPHINAAVHHCRVGEDGWMSHARTELMLAADTGWGRAFLRESPQFQSVVDQLSDLALENTARVKLTRTVEEFYTFSSLVNRTRRRDIGDFTLRRPETIEIPFTPSQQFLHDRLLGITAQILTARHGTQNVNFMMSTIRRQASSCLYGLNHLLKDMLLGQLQQLGSEDLRDDFGAIDNLLVESVRTEIEQLLEVVRTLDPYDPKVESFVDVLQSKQKTDNNKVLVFSTFRHTLAYLARILTSTQLRFGVVHGDVPDAERAALRRRFALSRENPQAIDILLSSEVGCEGLDFQFCDMLLNYDLPWNPMRIEQRIGRIDRFGQNSESVAVVNLITPDTVDADIYHRCLWRIGVFQRAIGGNEEILGEITREIGAIAESIELTDDERRLKLQQLADNSIRRLQEDQELESREAELFGLNIPALAWEDELEAANNVWLTQSALQNCVVQYLAARTSNGHDHLLGEKPIKTLRLNQEVRSLLLQDFRRLIPVTDHTHRTWEQWLRGSSPTLSVTFDQTAASEDASITFLSIAHPLVRQAAQWFEPTAPAYAVLTTKASGVPVGVHHFALYRWNFQGAKPDETFVAVASEPAIEDALFSLLESAVTDEGTPLPPTEEFDVLDARHHDKWIHATAQHLAANRQLVEFRSHSLSISHQARQNVIQDQLLRATDAKIRLMRQSELERANADYAQRMADLSQAAESGDIHATPVLFGLLTVEHP